MTRDFERQFPLPWAVGHNEYGVWVVPHGENAEGSTNTIWSGNQYPPRYEAVKYAVACANLMPEAVELIKYLREKMLEDASWVQFDGEEKIYACDEELKRIDNFLAKLERETE